MLILFPFFFNIFPVIVSGAVHQIFIMQHAPGGGWAAGLENDKADQVTVTNTGTIPLKRGLGLFLYGTEGEKVIAANAAPGTIYGGNEAIATDELY